VGRRTGRPIYEVDGQMVADAQFAITGEETGGTPGKPLLSVGGGVNDIGPLAAAKGVVFTSPDGLVVKRLRIDNAGNLPLASIINVLTIPGLVGWWKADALALAEDAAVASWTDSSGNGRHLLQADATKQPVYKAAVVGGKPVVRFTADFLKAVFTLGQPTHVLMVFRGTGTRVINEGAFDGATADTGYYYTLADGMATYAGTFGPSIVTTTREWHLHEVLFNGVGSEVRVDGGAAVTTPSPGTNTMGGLTVGAYGTGTTNFLNCDIAEVLVFNQVLSTSNRDDLELYIGEKYGLVIA